MRSGAGRVVVVAVLAVAVGPGCDGCDGAERGAAGEPDAPERGRLVVLGFEGVDPRSVEQWAEAGALPHLGQLMQAHAGRGFRRLGSTRPPQSSVSWASFATGLPPEEHGVLAPPRPRRPADPDRPPVEVGSQPPSWRWVEGRPQWIDRRLGHSFWHTAGGGGIAVHALDVPFGAAPEPVDGGRVLAGADVADSSGPGAHLTYVTSDPTDQRGAERASIRHRSLEMQQGQGRFDLPGPIGSDGSPMHVPVEIHVRTSSDEPDDEDVDELVAEQRKAEMARKGPPEHGMMIVVEGQQLRVQPRQLSAWARLTFRSQGQRVHGIVRFVPLEVGEHVRLLAGPVHIDPRRPWLPISHPNDFAAQLAQDLGRPYPTVGASASAEALEAGLIDEATFLMWVDAIANGRERMLTNALERDDWELLLWFSTAADRVAHMFYRLVDEDHPAHEPSLARRFHKAIEREYRRIDRIVGEVQANLREDDTLIVLSNHGMHAFRRGVHVNRWLLREGWLALKDGADRSGSPRLRDVDWGRTQAYALGSGAVYLNLEGREREGVVAAEDASRVCKAIRQRLLQLTDDEGGGRVVREVHVAREDVGRGQAGEGPELWIGFEPPYQSSWATGRGEVPKALFADNERRWSGEHAASAAALTPGMIASNRALREDPGIGDVAPTVLQFFDIEVPARYAGDSIFAEPQ